MRKYCQRRIHLNGHTMGFRPQTQKLELHYMSLGVKGLTASRYVSVAVFQAIYHTDNRCDFR